ncbi:SIR2 family protein [Marinobacter nauticus]|jgi:hypothetical protein|uniref:SIR2 family protein n=1 Tax=Marinobacter nauticus TaxID=2743 RepID=UPI002420107B|nr:SIR2 family protein [Marinobacter nauticus]
MTFKKKLADHFREFSASPFLFVGSGMSRRFIGAESWEALLKKFSDLIGENFTKIRSQADGDYPKIASLLAESYSQKWWDSEIKGQKDSDYSDDLVKKDSPLKVEICDYLASVHENINAEYQKEIDLLRESKIDGIITTNWDFFLESIFPEFSVFIGQDGLFSSRNHGIAEVYKIHGCASDPNSLVLTEEDYSKFRKKNPYLSSKLLTIFVEHPIIFLGYSLTDPHVLEILEEIVECIPPNKIDALRQNIVFVEWDPEIKEPALTESIILKTLPVYLIRTSSYIELFEVLSEIKRRIPAHIFRRIKDELYELVITNDPKGQLYVKDADNLENEENFQEFVVGYGAISKIKKSEELARQGIVGVDRDDIVRDVIFDNSNYNSRDIVFEGFPKIIKGNANIPVFKYLNGAGLIDDRGVVRKEGLCQQIISRIDSGIQKFKPTGYEERRSEGIPEVQQGVEELYKLDDFNLFLRMAVFVPPEIVDLSELSEILKKHAYDKFSSVERSQFIKIVCFYDFVKYSRMY